MAITQELRQYAQQQQGQAEGQAAGQALAQEREQGWGAAVVVESGAGVVAVGEEAEAEGEAAEGMRRMSREFRARGAEIYQ